MALKLVDNVMHVKANSTMRLFSPAKVNLHLAVTGKRDDGFHELISLVSPISFGDYLTVTRLDTPAGIEFSCTEESVPTGEANLVVQAARAFLDSVDSSVGLKIHLEKYIPMEAGLGGGSSNAATTLLMLNELFGGPKDVGGLSQLAENLGSDCSLFLHQAPVLMRGRGERIEQLPREVILELAGRSIAVFKPGVGISTAWAYDQLKSHHGLYANAVEVEEKISHWREGRIDLEDLLFNTFEKAVFEKYVLFPALFDQINAELNLRCLMSGSGSSCVVLLTDVSQGEKLKMIVNEALGEDAFFEFCRLGWKKE